MAEYIRREAILNRLAFEDGRRIPEVDVDNFPITISIKDIKKLIRDVPAENVKPVVYGQWVQCEEWPTCSICRAYAPSRGGGLLPYKSPYCFMCGAEMDGGVNQNG